MKRAFVAAAAALALCACATSSGGTAGGAERPATVAELMAGVDVPYESFTLDNGLTVLVHEDRKAPIVAVASWFNVGSKDEPQGRTGFAHLFEHIMLFNGTEHIPNLIEPLREWAPRTGTAQPGSIAPIISKQSRRLHWIARSISRASAWVICSAR